MAKISVNPLILLIRKRCYRVAAAAEAETAARKVVEEMSSVSGDGAKEKKEFWMRDPKSGNWIPENRFGEIDVAELRNKYLSNNAARDE